MQVEVGMAVGREDEDQFIGDRLGGLSLMLDFFTTCSCPYEPNVRNEPNEFRNGFRDYL